MKVNDSHYINPALQLIKNTDVAIYDAMIHNPWQLNAIDEPSDAILIRLMEVLSGEENGVIGFVALIEGLGHAFGTTFEQEGVPHSLRYTTWLNRGAIADKATDLGVPVDDFLADVIVHEFNHITGGDEPEAYNAGTQFADKLGDETIAEFSQQSKFQDALRRSSGSL